MSSVITVNDVLNNIEKNGIPQAHEDYFIYREDDRIVKACAIGMAAINLSYAWPDLREQLNQYRYADPEANEHATGIGILIEIYNDCLRLSFQDIAARVRDKGSEFLDSPIFLKDEYKVEYQTVGEI